MKTRAEGRTQRRVAGFLAAGAAAALLATGCSGPGAAAPSGSEGAPAGESTTVSQFAIVTPEKETDYGWNQQGLWAAASAAEELGLTLDEHAEVGYDNPETILTQVADAGNDLVIAHASGFVTAAMRVAQTTQVPMVVVDVEADMPGLVGTIMHEAHEGGYLAGVAAAHATETGTLGIVLSADDLNWMTMSGGFIAGARSVDPEIEIHVAQIGPAEYGDSAGGRNVAAQVIASGADVIFGMGDGATVGYLQAIETAETDQPIWYIGTIGDVTPALDDASFVLTSVLWDYHDTYVQIIDDLEAGTFAQENYVMNVENGGMRLLETDNLTDEMLAAVEAATEGVVSGSVDVPRTTTMDEVNALLNG